jgi:FkbM family methyltransferase
MNTLNYLIIILILCVIIYLFDCYFKNTFNNSNLQALIKTTNKILTEKQITYWISGATLLSSIKNKQLLPWLNNADFCIMESEVNKLLKMKKILKHNNLGMIEWFGGYKIYDLNSTKIKNKEYGYPFINIFVCIEIDNKIVYKSKTAMNMWKNEYFNSLLPLKLYELGDTKLYGPNNPNDYLDRVFPNWKTRPITNPWKKSYELLKNTDIYNEYAYVRYWKRLQPTNNWYAFNERLGIQRESYSDIMRNNVKYELFTNINNNIVDIVFVNDNNIIIKVDKTLQYSETYGGRVNAEQKFRKIINYMIQNNYINKDKNIIDLGAWIGDNSLPWAKNINGIVYAIDPSSDNCSFIKELIQINNISNVNIIQTIISDKEEELSIEQGDINHAKFTTNIQGTKFKSSTLDSLNNLNIITNIGFIHLDVEGMEFKVILGGDKLIKTERPIVAYEGHSDTDLDLDDIKKYFIKEDYSIFKIEEICGANPTCRNSLAIPNSIVRNIDFNHMFSNLNIDKTIFFQEY